MKQLCIVIDSGGKFVTDSGSVMHGMLMDMLPAPWPDKLHRIEKQIFSQWLEVSEHQENIWHIGILDDELADEMLFQIQQRETVFSTHLNQEVILGKTDILDLPFREYLSSYIMADETPEDLRISFRTPTAHKSRGVYQIIPSVSLIAGSLQRRAEQIDPGGMLGAEDVAEKITENTKVIRYRLESRPYNLEGTRVFGYTGTMELRFSGEPILRRLSAALFSLADWTGVGIKTALGMGGCKTELLRKSGTGGGSLL